MALQTCLQSEASAVCRSKYQLSAWKCCVCEAVATHFFGCKLTCLCPHMCRLFVSLSLLSVAHLPTSGLYFGVGQGLGALIGGVLKERFGGQAMFALCAGLILAAWLLVVAAECATGSSSSSSTAVVEASASMSVQHTSEKQVDGYPVSSQQQRARAREEQQRQAQLQEAESLPHQQPSGLWLLPQRWWQRARQGLGGGGVHGSNRSRQWKYLELGSKDSGPDLGAMMMMQQQQQ